MNCCEMDKERLVNDKRFNSRQRVLMYADRSNVGHGPSSDELKRIYAILFHHKDIAGLERFCGRYKLEELYPDPMPELPTVTDEEVIDDFDEIWKFVIKINPSVKKTESRKDPMAKYPYPGRKAYRRRIPGAPSLTIYFIESDDGNTYFLKRSYLEDQPKHWLLRFAAVNKIYVTTPMSIKGTIDDLSLNALVLQILADPKHEAALIKAIQSRKSKLQPEDVEALLTGEYQIIDR